MTKPKCLTLFTCCLTATLLLAEAEDDHESAVELTEVEREAAGIVVATVSPQLLNEVVRAPGEVSMNAYRSVRVTPRITAQVIERHVKLGDEVELGQRMVTLSSVEMAEAQAQLIVADQEWQRVESLDKEAVSERRHTEALVARQLALAKVLGYGMTEEQAANLMQSGNASKATGQFDLLAPQNGTVLLDSFVVGELIEPGRVLFDLSEESVLWVEAQIAPNELPSIESIVEARVSPDGVDWYAGRVIQWIHRVDQTTRTQSLRLEVENTDHSLHPGQFVEVEFVVESEHPVLAVPTRALTMIDGVYKVFVLKHNVEFHPEELETGRSTGDWTTVLSGLSDGDEIVVDGVFHLKSILLKTSIGEGHVH